MPNTPIISKIQIGSSDPAVVRDSASLHYRNHFDYGLTPVANTKTYTGTPTTAASGGTDLDNIREYDFITYGEENLNLVCTTATSPITWTVISESAASGAITAVTVNGTSVVSGHTAAIVINANTIAVDDETSTNNVLPEGITTPDLTSESADGAIANKKYVDDATVLAGHMKFIGTVGDSGASVPDITTLPTTSTGSKASVEVGYTYKVAVAGTYASQPAKLGDLFICNNVSKTGSGAEPTWTYSWSYVPSGDDVEVSEVGTSGVGIKTTNKEGTADIEQITTTGKVSLKLVSNDALSGTVSAATGEYRTLPVGVDTTNGNLATAVPAGTLSEVLVGSATSAAVTSLSKTTSAGASNIVVAHVGDTTASPAEDAETLYIDPLYFTSIANAVTYTAPQQSGS